MKKLLTLLIALQLSMIFVGFQGFEPTWAGDDVIPTPTAPPPAGGTPAPATPATSTPACADVLTKGVNKGTPPTTIKTSDVIVLLTEGIAPGGEGASCGKIIECLRIQYAPLKSLADAKVIEELRTKYWQCIVSGKDGLDLLNNYAGLVYRWIAGIVGAICILMIIISGIQISMGGLSQEEVSEAKDRIVRSLTGLVVIFLSAFILYTINPIFFT